MAAEPISLLFISDFVCPWCYLGVTEVERLQREYDVEVAFAPYLLDPSTPPEGKPRHAPDERRFAQDRHGSARRRSGHSLHAWPHDHVELAPRVGGGGVRGRTGAGDGIPPRDVRSYFEELADIGQVDTVVRVGESVGLDGAELRAALGDGRFREQVDEGIEWARSVGVSGVPTFVIDEQYGVVGAQDHTVFVDLLKRIGREPLAAR